MSLITLSAGQAGVVVDPALGGRLVSWRVGDLELLGGHGRQPEESGCYPMAPWAGRLRGNAVRVNGAVRELPATYLGWAMHGLVLGSVWDVVHVEPTSTCLSVALDDPWPWPAVVTLDWRLTATELSSRLTVHTEAEPFAAGVGWHPWFRRRLARGEELRWDMAATAMRERGDDHLPTGRDVEPRRDIPLDDAFAVPDGRIEIVWPGALAMTCQSDVGWITVYDERPDLVCLEPQSLPPDGLSSTEVRARPGAPVSGSVTWSWRDA